jgi:hypothetical protein
VPAGIKNGCLGSDCARLPAHGEHCCPRCRPLLGCRPAWPRAPGLWQCKHRDWHDADPEEDGNGQTATSKQAKTAAKVDSGGGANNPARKGERQSRRRSPRARARAVAALQIDEAAAATALPQADAENSAASTTNDQRLAPAVSVSQGADGATEGASGADRPRGSTKRAKLITNKPRALPPPRSASTSGGCRIPYAPPSPACVMPVAR